MSEATVYTPPLDDTLATHVLDVLLNGEERADPSVDPTREKVLEVVQVFGDAVLDIKHFAPGRAVSLGATLVRGLRGTRMVEDFFVPTSALPAPTHPLFEADGAGWSVVVSPEWEGFVDGPSGLRELSTLAAMVTPGADGLLRLAIGPADRAVIQIGTSTFVARPVHPSKRVPVYGGDGIDYPLLGITGFMGFVAMMLGVALAVLPAPPKSSTRDEESHLIDLLLQQAPPAPKPVAQADGPEGAKAKGKEGKRGDPKSPEPKDRSPIPKKDSDRAAADAAGVLGALQANAALDSILGDAGLPSALSDGVGGLIGPRATQVGSGGLAARGGGIGGGGTVEGVGGLGLKDRGHGGGCQGALCGGTRTVKPEGTLALDPGTIVIGGLNKSLIDEVIKRNLAQVRYCYQRELTKNPNLGGKVTVKFVIAGDGSVSSATTKSSTLGSSAAESCINARFMRFQFPQPKGNGIVIVSYPFLFAPG